MSNIKAIKAAKDLLGNIGDIKLPIDVRNIIRREGIFLTESPHQNEDLSGVIISANEKTFIAINALHSETRKRFTMAHELGHYLLHQKDVFVDRMDNFVKFRKQSKDYDPEEVEANIFAAELLMPAGKLEKHFAVLKEFEDSSGEFINLLAKKYSVSTEAMKYRLISLNLIIDSAK